MYYPSHKKGKPFFKHSDLKDKSGVYLIRTRPTLFKKPEIVYIGESGTQLYKTIYRHFQTWNDSRQHRYTFKNTGLQIRIILCSPKRAKQLEELLIKKHRPKFNKEKYPDEPTPQESEKQLIEQTTNAREFVPKDDEPF